MRRSFSLFHCTVLVCALVLAMTSTAWAGADSGFYIGGSVGSASQDLDAEDVSIDDDASGSKVFAGYNIGLVPFLDLAVEGSYVDFGEISSPITGGIASAEVEGLNAFGLVGFKFGLLGFFAKTGLVNWESDYRVLGVKSDDSGTDAAYGLGVRFQFSSIAVRAEYELFDIDNSDISFYSVGASWTF